MSIKLKPKHELAETQLVAMECFCVFGCHVREEGVQRNNVCLPNFHYCRIVCCEYVEYICVSELNSIFIQLRLPQTHSFCCWGN